MRDVEIRRYLTFYRADYSGNKPKPLMLSVFIGLVEKKLHPEADSEKRLSCLCLLLHKIKKI